VQRQNTSIFTFFAILAYVVCLLLLAGFIVGNVGFAANWWLLVLFFAVGVAFTGTAIREGREAEETAIVPTSRVAEPITAAAAPAKPPAKKTRAAAPPDPKPKTEAAPAAPDPKPAPAKAKADPDDLRRIEGIGPKIASALIAQGIDTFEKLSKQSLEELQSKVKAEGVRFSPSAESWAEQASYAAKGDWDGLQTLQDTLIGGRYPKS
jgi:predicted flap endonuclease-1-like 5' DNA nuclease